MLYIHNFIEHDGSISRLDYALSPLGHFDEATFDNYVSYFNSSDSMDIESTAYARAHHVYDRSKDNPNLSITRDQLDRLLLENAMLLSAYGHPEHPVANRKYFEFFFRKYCRTVIPSSLT